MSGTLVLAAVVSVLRALVVTIAVIGGWTAAGSVGLWCVVIGILAGRVAWDTDS